MAAESVASEKDPLNSLDFSGKALKKVPSPTSAEEEYILTLNLNHNEISKLDGIEKFGSLAKLSLSHNSICRMYGVNRLYYLKQLDLSFNNVPAIEGLRELVHLQWLSLAGNNLKSVDHLNTNTHLSHLDVSSNCISGVADLRMLKNLKTLLLHDNRISDLSFCDRRLPKSLTTVTLNSNVISDLAQISRLKSLPDLKRLTIAGNPCVEHDSEDLPAFDHRPFVINWCLNLRVLDGVAVDPQECLKAEWLYSQGKGRHFGLGQHRELVQYLSGCCPLPEENADVRFEEEEKLSKVLQKAREHQLGLASGSVDGGGPGMPVSAVKESVLSPRGSSASGAHKADGSLRGVVHRPHSGGASPHLTSSRRPLSVPPSHSDRHSKLPNAKAQPKRQLYQFQLSTSLYSPGPPGLERRGSESRSPSTPSEPESIPDCMIRSWHPGALQAALQGSTQNGKPSSRPSAHNNGGGVQRSSSSARVGDRSRSKSSSDPDRQPQTPTTTKPTVTKGKHGSTPKAGHRPSGVPTLSHSKTSPAVVMAAQPPKKANGGGPPGHRPTPTNGAVRPNSASKATTRPKPASGNKLGKASTTQSHEHLPFSRLHPPIRTLKEQQAAVTIQKVWRGHRVRHLCPEIQKLMADLRARRAEDHIRHLTSVVGETRAALEVEKMRGSLLLDAVTKLWQEVQRIQKQKTTEVVEASPGPAPSQEGSREDMGQLLETCQLLQRQVLALEGTVADLRKALPEKADKSVSSCSESLATVIVKEASTVAQMKSANLEEKGGGDAPPVSSASSSKTKGSSSKTTTERRQRVPRDHLLRTLSQIEDDMSLHPHADKIEAAGGENSQALKRPPPSSMPWGAPRGKVVYVGGVESLAKSLIGEAFQDSILFLSSHSSKKKEEPLFLTVTPAASTSTPQEVVTVVAASPGTPKVDVVIVDEEPKK